MKNSNSLNPSFLILIFSSFFSRVSIKCQAKFKQIFENVEKKENANNVFFHQLERINQAMQSIVSSEICGIDYGMHGCN